MKQQLLAACVCMLVACNTATTSTTIKDTTAATTDATAMSTNVTYAYPVEYSSDFIIGDSKYAQTVLELWKAWDNNSFDDHKDAFADSVSMDFSDGSSVINMSRDSLVAMAKKSRGSLKNAVSSVEVITALKPKGKDESWVCVWGKEVDTHNNGKVDSINHNENWMFNKEGKIVYMGQYEAKPYVPAKK